MKRLFLICLLLASCFGFIAEPASAVKKTKLSVLYVGGSSDWQREAIPDSAAYQQSVKERTEAFAQLLGTYFTDVKVIDATDYKQSLSEQYDVTVMDGLPQPIAPAVTDAAKGIYKRAAYLTEDFSSPMVCIAEMSSFLGSRIGLKNDWYCLCLDAYAHSWKQQHPIFKGPYPVKLETEIRPTPEEALMSSYYFEDGIPDKIPMWQVQTKGYKTDKGFRVGLVSRPWGYEDCGDAEIISSGVCSKSLDAVALGRHGNFFHWGFSASPAYMTEQAKAVFANAIVYIAKFKGQIPIVRKYNETIPTIERLLDYKFLASKKGYDDYVATSRLANETIKQTADEAKKKQAEGQPLTETEKAYLQAPPLKIYSRKEMMKMYLAPYYPMFGTDEQAYDRYFDENKPYFYPDENGNHLEVDEDVKSLGMSNHDLKLIDTAIGMLERGEDTEKAQRILERYTLGDFNDPAEWRRWFDKNRRTMFFSEAGGWVFLINSREKGVNDYSAWERRKQAAAVVPGETSDKSPVAVTAKLDILSSGEKVVYVKFKVQPGYYIYAHTASDSPFVPTTVRFVLPTGYSLEGNLKIPASRFYTQSGTTVFDGEFTFSQAVTGEGEGDIKCVVGYQCCDNHVCFQPVEKELTVQ